MTGAMAQTKLNIVLCGFMGCGKSTVGKKLSQMTQMEFVDMDGYIEKRAGMKIPDIFEKHGEGFFRDLEHEKAWLIRTTLHRACDVARAAERRNLPLETAEVLPGGEMPEPSPILSAVQALPAKYSAVIHLYYYEGYSIKEISKLLQIPLPTVGTRLSRGRERLRQLLKEDVE